MKYKDLPAFWTRLTETPGVAALALQFLILTATRTSETLGAQWDEISFADETWVIPKERMKMGEAFSVPLSDAALRLLADQMSHRGKSPYVFPGRPRAPLSNMSMSMLLRRMGESVTVHGFQNLIPHVVQRCRPQRVRGCGICVVASGRRRNIAVLQQNRLAGETASADGALGELRREEQRGRPQGPRPRTAQKGMTMLSVENTVALREALTRWKN